MTLKKYKAKRNLTRSKEPPAKKKTTATKRLIFVVQKHRARSLHYDLRLEKNGVLKSWAVPKGPSMNPKEKRLAIQVEDHPYAYKDFEGVIPEGYGKGAVIVWDRGTYTLDFRNAKIWVFTLRGKKLKGGFSLVKFRDTNWLLIKKKDRYASSSDITKKERSIISHKKLDSFIEAKPRGQSPRRPSKTLRRKKRSTARE